MDTSGIGSFIELVPMMLSYEINRETEKRDVILMSFRRFGTNNRVLRKI